MRNTHWDNPDENFEPRRGGRGPRSGHGNDELHDRPRRATERGRGRSRGRWGYGPDDFSAEDGRPRRRGRVRRGDVRLAILSLLTEEPLNGYQMIQALADRTNGIWKPSPGAVYPALNQLEDEGLIEAFDNNGQKAFRLTEDGVAAASEIDPKPWDLVNDEAGANTEGSATLWREYGALARAAKAVMASGTPEQIQAAATSLADTRKRLFGILAEDSTE